MLPFFLFFIFWFGALFSFVSRILFFRSWGRLVRVLNFRERIKKPKNNKNAFYPKPKFQTLAALFDFWGCWFLFESSMFKRLRLFLLKMGSTFKKQCKYYRFFRIFYLAVIFRTKTDSDVSEDGFYVRVLNFGSGWKNQKNNKNAFYQKPKFETLTALFDFWGC